MTDLKPCPFCGGTDLTTETDDGIFWVTCKGCYAEGPYLNIRADADAADWNTRASPKVKPLEWTEGDDWGMTKNSLLRYEYYAVRDGFNVFCCSDGKRIATRCKNPKSVAQADFENRLLLVLRLEPET